MQETTFLALNGFFFCKKNTLFVKKILGIHDKKSPNLFKKREIVFREIFKLIISGLTFKKATQKQVNYFV